MRHCYVGIIIRTEPELHPSEVVSSDLYGDSDDLSREVAACDDAVSVLAASLVFSRLTPRVSAHPAPTPVLLVLNLQQCEIM